MPLPCSPIARLSAALSVSLLLLACSDSSDDNNNPGQPPVIPDPEITYDAQITWTEYGIPHIKAEDWGSLGYGSGYSYAQENFCVGMKEYVRAKGESARYFGAEGDLNQDFIMKLFNDDARIERLWEEDVPDYLQEMIEGYVAGVNRYLQETGVDQLAEGDEGCRGAEWVREIDTMDSLRLFHRIALRGSARPLADLTVAAQPPELTAARTTSSPEAIQQLALLDHEAVARAIDLPEASAIGSNAYAVGEEASQTNSGVLFGNPHFPWQGPERFVMFHLTLGDEYDVMGATLHGLPIVGIGFNDSVAWTHTVSIASRFTFYELELNPDNVMEYNYDGEFRALESRTVTAEQVGDGGNVESVDHTFYFSHYGPILDLGELSPLLAGWPNAVGTLVTYRDANLENLRAFDQFVKMGQAADLGEFKEALQAVGLPLFNTIAADRNGDAFYGDISTVPNVSITQYSNCVRGLLQTLLTSLGRLTMDGSDSSCEWGSDEDSPVEGVFGYDGLPKLETRGYAANANDSYWLSNPRELLTGFSPILGPEEVEQSMRTRHTFNMADRRLAGQDGLGENEVGFTVDNVRKMHYQATNYVAERIADDVIDICMDTTDWSPYTSNTAMMQDACSVLSEWDQRHLVDSVGGHLFYEFWLRVRDTPNLWVEPFDPADPVNTPNVISVEPEVLDATRQALADATARLADAGIPLDRPWGEVQYVEKNGERYPIHGGSGSMMFSVITSDLVDGEGYSNIRHGNSYIQAVTWDESDCPDAYAILTYSQSTDPASDHYADATGLYSDGGWIDMPYCQADQDAQELRRENISE